jgi:hypothetical protein
MPFPVLTAGSFLLAAATSPLGAAPAASNQALAIWAAAYDACYAPAHFSLGVDQPLTVRCIERSLRKARADAPVELQGPLDGLIRETPRLVGALAERESSEALADRREGRAGQNAAGREGKSGGATHGASAGRE